MKNGKTVVKLFNAVPIVDYKWFLLLKRNNFGALGNDKGRQV